MNFVEMRESFVETLRAGLPQNIVEFADEHDLVIAGGALRDIFRGVPYRDVDVFVGDRLKASGLVYDYEQKYDSGGLLHTTTPNSFTTSDNVQFIFGRGRSMTDVLEGFDFSVNMLAIRGRQGLEYPDARTHISERTIFVPDPNCHTLLAHRIAKLQSQGYAVASQITSATTGRGNYGQHTL